MHGSFIYDKVARTSGVRYVALLSNKDKTQDLMIIMTIIAITVMHSALQLILIPIDMTYALAVRYVAP